MGIAAAAAIGGVASLGGALLQSSASQKASQEQAQTAQEAIAAQQQMFGVAQSALSPFYTAAAGNIPQLQSALTNVAGLTSPGSMNQNLTALPGFQFQSNWGTKQATNALSAEGLGGSTGPLATAVSQYNNGLAGTYYNNYVNNALGAAGAQQNFVNSGTGAAGALAGNATATGQGIAGSLGNLGAAQASGTLGSANALAGGLTGGAGSISNALLLNSLITNGGSANGLYGAGSDLALGSSLTGAP